MVFAMSLNGVTFYDAQISGITATIIVGVSIDEFLIPPLLVDTDDPALNRSLSGYLRITTGYKDQVIYPVANPE